MPITSASNVVFLDPKDILPQVGPPAEPQRRVIDTVNQKVAGAQSLGHIMDFLFETMGDICPCDRLGLAFFEEDEDRVVAWYARANYEPVVLDKGYAESLGENTLGGLIENGRLRIINDLSEYGRARPESVSSQLLLKEGVRSSLTYPLNLDGRTVGLLFRSSRLPHAYSLRQALIHSLVAERLSQAVEKAWRIEQLTRANDAYMEMLGFVSHELKNPVSSLVMDAQLLADGYLGDLEPKQREKVQAIIRKGEYLLELTRDYLELARLEAQDLRLNVEPDVDVLTEIIEPAVDFIATPMEEKGMRLMKAIEQPLRAQCDPNLLRVCLVNLLGNAVKYGAETGQIRLRAEYGGASVFISVWNEGAGFHPSQKSRLFKKFSRLPTPQKSPVRGTGVGLYTAWRIVRLHGGEIWADSRPWRWAEFSFEIPQPLPDKAVLP